MEASNADTEVPPNLMTDLAYQALENLAFDDMTVVVNSLDAGRLNLRFAIHGRHDPPQKQEIRLTWLQVLRRQFFDKPLPLPSGTGVNLNLDTTLNANQLIGDLLELNRVRQGQVSAETPPAPEIVQGPFTPHRVKVGDVIDSGVAIMITKRTLAALVLGGLAAAGASACTPTVRLEVAPITINATLSADVRIRLDKELQTLLQENPNLF